MCCITRCTFIPSMNHLEITCAEEFKLTYIYKSLFCQYYRVSHKKLWFLNSCFLVILGTNAKRKLNCDYWYDKNKTIGNYSGFCSFLRDQILENCNNFRKRFKIIICVYFYHRFYIFLVSLFSLIAKSIQYFLFWFDFILFWLRSVNGSIRPMREKIKWKY